MKNAYLVSTEQHGDMKSGISRSKNSTILQAGCPSAPVETSKFVPVTHYDVSITLRLAKNI